MAGLAFRTGGEGGASGGVRGEPVGGIGKYLRDWFEKWTW